MNANQQLVCYAMKRIAGLKIHTIGVGADEMWIRSLFGKRKVNPSSELDEKILIDNKSYSDCLI